MSDGNCISWFVASVCIFRNPVTSMLLGNELQCVFYLEMTIKIMKMTYNRIVDA